MRRDDTVTLLSTIPARVIESATGAGWIGGWWRLLLLVAIWAGIGRPMHALAALDWRQGQGYRVAPLTVAPSDKAGFESMPSALTGLAFTNHLEDLSAAQNQIRMVGSGVALGDVDGDGRCDIYLCRLEGDNALYRNLGGWKFEEITGAAGVGCPGQYSTGAVMGDVDGDGDLDLIVNGIGTGTRMFLNDGKARFQEPNDRGLTNRFCATTAALGDMDQDGDLDLYVAHYRTTTIRSTGLEVLNINGQRVLRPEDRDQFEITAEGFIREHGEADALYLNDGRGRFTAVSWTTGRFLDPQGRPLAQAPRDWGLTATVRDLNQDGSPDFYVCNDFWSPDQIWMNDGQGQFRALSNSALRHTSAFSMGMDVADLDRDGDDDFLVLDMLSRDHQRRMRQTFLTGTDIAQPGMGEDRPQIERNTLFLNRGDGTYAEIAHLAGLHASEWSWSILFLDVDLDGFEDALITTGHDFDTQDADATERIAQMGPAPPGRFGESLLQHPRLFLPNLAYRNRGDLTFEEVGSRWGFDQTGVSHGMALADLDGDGDQDVVVNHLNAAVGVYRFTSAAPRVAVRVRGLPGNGQGIGTRLRLSGGAVAQSQELMAGGRYLSGDDPMRVFAVSASEGGQEWELEVTWPGGKRSRLAGIQTNHFYELDAATMLSEAASQSASPKAEPEGFFQDVSHQLLHRHQEPVFDDWARHPLLSRRLSQDGPGVSWADIDGDQWEDLIIGSGRGGQPAVFRNQGNGSFLRLTRGADWAPATGDLTTLLGVETGPGQMHLLVGHSNYESGNADQAAVLVYERWAGGLALRESLPCAGADAGPLAVSDVDGDGDLDLFVGGRSRPDRYPEPSPARLYESAAGTFKLAHEWPSAGVVNAAALSDLTGDGLPELLLACEWGPLRIWQRQGTNWIERTQSLGFGEYSGLWNGVATGDFDGDGALDVVASNWGRNSPYEEFPPGSVMMVYGDFDETGVVQGIEARHDPVLNKLVPLAKYDRMITVFPWLKDRYATWTAYSQASVAELLGERMRRAQHGALQWLSSSVFLNRGSRFQIVALPVEAQLAPAFGVAVGDLDGDSHEDLFLAQNFFAVDPSMARYDAGQGLWLRGDGTGGFRAVSARESGIRLYGEQRGAAMSDYDGDGRLDLAVGQSGGSTVLLRNMKGARGVRVRVRGPASNPRGVGVAVWMEFENGERSHIKEIGAGNGHWSQQGAVLVFSARRPPMWLVSRWPGGKQQRHQVTEIEKARGEVQLKYLEQ